MNEWLLSFNNADFMPHGFCYQWRPDILWTHVLSDVAIGISYLLIPVIIWALIYKRNKNLPFLDVLGLFMAFIFFCGVTHFLSVVVVWNPIYEYQGWLKALTAFISVLTVIVLIPKLSFLASLPGIEEAYRKSQQELKALKEKIAQMNSVYTVTLDREERIIELKKEVNQLLADQNSKPIYDI